MPHHTNPLMGSVKGAFTAELIGSIITIVEASNNNFVGLSGKIVDETKETIRLRIANTTKTIFKRGIVFTLRDGRTIVGSTIALRPHERMKTK